MVSDSFWLIVSKYFKRDLEKSEKTQSLKVEVAKLLKEEPKLLYAVDQLPNCEGPLLKRISRNYINLFLSIDHKEERQFFFKTYFDIIA